MDDENTNSLWDGKSAQPLRRPTSTKFNTLVNNTNVQETRNNSEDLSNSFNNLDILSKSSLSASAKEWYPPNYNRNNKPNRTSHPAQDRLKRMKQKFDTSNENKIDENVTQNDDNVDECHAVQQLEELMENLIINPADFHLILGTFTELMTPYYDDFTFIDYVTELIVEKVLSEPNFRYSAVRLCVVVQEDCGLFRSALCLLCEKKTNISNDFNLTMLLAELYVQLNYDKIYAALLIKSLVGILATGDGNSVKAACQVLKLTGFALESTNKKEVNNIFKQLLTTQENQLLPIKNLIDSVVSLRQENWGRTTNNINITNHSNHSNEIVHDGPIFYGPDGQELTEEEHQFLDDNCSSQSETYTEDNEDCWDPEMTDEMRHAFEEFIRFEK